MQSRRKVTLASLMLFLVFWNGMLGNTAVATLCLHEHGIFHLEHGSCDGGHAAEEAQHEAEEHGCCDHDEEGPVLLGAEACYDFELKGIDDSYRAGARSVSIPQLVFADLITIDLTKLIAPAERFLRKEASPRAPPDVARLSEQVVEKTVLRL